MISHEFKMDGWEWNMTSVHNAYKWHINGDFIEESVKLFKTWEIYFQWNIIIIYDVLLWIIFIYISPICIANWCQIFIISDKNNFNIISMEEITQTTNKTGV